MLLLRVLQPAWVWGWNVAEANIQFLKRPPIRNRGPFAFSGHDVRVRGGRLNFKGEDNAEESFGGHGASACGLAPHLFDSGPSARRRGLVTECFLRPDARVVPGLQPGLREILEGEDRTDSHRRAVPRRF